MVICTVVSNFILNPKLNDLLRILNLSSNWMIIIAYLRRENDCKLFRTVFIIVRIFYE